MEKSTEQIRKHSDTIDDEIRKSRKQIDLLLRKAKDTLKALSAEIRKETVERGSPITLPNSSLSGAVAALGGGEAA